MFALDYPLRWEMYREVSEAYKKIGSFMSAYELMVEVELDEEAIKCLFMAGRQTRANDLAQKYI